MYLSQFHRFIPPRKSLNWMWFSNGTIELYNSNNDKNAWHLLMCAVCQAPCPCLILVTTSWGLNPMAVTIVFYYFFNPHQGICLLIWKREEEREIHWCERKTSISCLLYAPQPGVKHTTSVWAPTGIKPTTFWCTGRCSNQLSLPARAPHYFTILQMKNLRHCLNITVSISSNNKW